MGQRPDDSVRLRFSSFFRSVIIELDKEAYGPDNHLTEWHRGKNTEDIDGFTVRYHLYVCMYVLYVGMYICM